MRLIFPIILIILAIGAFVMFTRPLYGDVKALRVQLDSYNQALTNAQQLQTERDAVSQKYHQLPPEDISRLEKLLPDTADSIHVIIDLQRIAQTYGMSVSGVKFDADTSSAGAANAAAAVSTADAASGNQDYGTFRISFTTTATYENFLKFIQDIQSSLRLTDIESVDFTSNDSANQAYTYTIRLKTYWLKS